MKNECEKTFLLFGMHAGVKLCENLCVLVILLITPARFTYSS